MEDNRQRLKRLKSKANGLPLTPGVYIMRNSSGDIIYIGKAKALKNRVTQYFSQKGQDIEKVQKMVDNVRDFDYILTDSEFEALVLECNLIKLHKPKYNILLKDDKGYHYIRISNDSWRRITFENRKDDDNATYIGPYTGGFLISQSVDDAKKIFKLPTCSKEFPRDLGKGRPCLNYYISQCSAPCAGKISQRDYNKSVEDAVAFLRGSDKTLIREMTAEMEKASDELDFERAAVLRDRLAAVRKLSSRQKVISDTHPQQDVFALAAGDGKACFAVLRFNDGRLTDSGHYIFDNMSDEASMRASFISAYYETKKRIPPRIAADGNVEGAEVLQAYLSEKRSASVQIVVPARGEQAKLVDMCRNNALQKLTEYFAGKSGRELEGLLELQVLLKLPELPRYIESYDISHTGGNNVVGGMIVFRDGKPLKSAYRRFSVNGFEGQDDCRALSEVIDRRFGEYEKASDKTKGFGVMPDLILLDGGKLQVNAVKEVLKEHGIRIPLFGMVKDSKHRTAAIATEGERVEFNVKRKAFTLVTNIQDEVHRFAITYHKKKRSKSAFSSSLCEIDGIGQARAKALLKHFRTMKAIENATAEELSCVKGISITAAQSVYNHFHPEKL